LGQKLKLGTSQIQNRNANYLNYNIQYFIPKSLRSRDDAQDDDDDDNNNNNNIFKGAKKP
jgi:hypothetical protein